MADRHTMRVSVPELWRWDAQRVEHRLRGAGPTSSVLGVRKALGESGGVLELEFARPVRAELVEREIHSMIWGENLPDRGHSLWVHERSLLRPFSSALARQPIEIRPGTRLEVHDVAPLGEMVLIVRGGNHAGRYVILTPDEYEKLRREGALSSAPKGRKNDSDEEGDPQESPAEKASSIFVRTGSYARVNADFPKFPKRPLLRTYMTVTDRRLKTEMPVPETPEGEDEGDSE